LWRIIKRIVLTLFGLAGLVVLGGGAWLYVEYQRLLAELPDIASLRTVHYQIPMSIYSKEGWLIAEFGEKKRLPVSLKQVPPLMIQAFLAAEDDRFFEHPGVDYQGLARAAIDYLLTGKKRQGGSTITMQVARNFLLSSEKTFERKAKEILLALRIEQEFSKEAILELYLNQIYLGQRAYGIAAAAQVYYGKMLRDLNLAEIAMIAGLPKAPSRFNPVTNAARAGQRRDYVLNRMLELGYIDATAHAQALATRDNATVHQAVIELAAPYVAEMVRQDLVQRYGEAAYTLGLRVYTTVEANLQLSAVRALQHALHAYDERHGLRDDAIMRRAGPSQLAQQSDVGDTQPAWVLTVAPDHVTAKLKNGHPITIDWRTMQWARRFLSPDQRGPVLRRPGDVVQPGDLICVRQQTDGTWALTQNPAVEGALVALDADNGAVLALVGGFDFARSPYNRATQTKRQPGSGFKPVIYTAALEQGYSLATMVNDAPLVIDIPGQNKIWRPENYNRRFRGPTSLRVALRHSINLVAVRLARDLGIDTVIATAKRLGFDAAQLPYGLSLALGSGHATPLDMARLYAVYANGGFLIEPYWIARIEDYNGRIVQQAQPVVACASCPEEALPAKPAPRVLSPQVNFLMNVLLRDVVQHGTATAAKALGRDDLAGKTGTTNEQRDAWFNGFVAPLVATAWVGYDNAQSLGRDETGGKAALPMWMAFMRDALQDIPERPLTPPPGIVRAYINPTTGLRLPTDDPNGIWEYFITGTVPPEQPPEDNFFDDQDSDHPLESLF